MAFIPRLHGPVLTHASTGELADCIIRGQYNAQKVITEWGPQGKWTDDARRKVVTKTLVGQYPPKTIVRTFAGDGQSFRYADDPSDPSLYPIPNKIAEEIKPWYELEKKIYVEVGNEPNTQAKANEPGILKWWDYFKDGTPDQQRRALDYVWNWRYWFIETVKLIRSSFPGIKIISPGMSKNTEPDPAKPNALPLDLRGLRGEEVWYKICQDAFLQADFIGLHWFADKSFKEDWGAVLLPILQKYYPYAPVETKPYFITEYGLNTLSLTDRQKGKMYAEFVHFGGSEPALPAAVKGAVYYHFDSSKAKDPQYHIADGGGDDAYRERCNSEPAPPPPPSPTDRIGVNQRLNRGSALRSPNGRYALHLQAGDGNLVLYNAAGVAIWSTYRPGGEFLVLQQDGNLVVYPSSGPALWASNTVGSGAYALVVQDDGNVVLYSPTRAVWATNTVGR